MFVAVTSLNYTECGVVVVLQPISPERAFDINAVFSLVSRRNASAVVNHAAFTTEEHVVKAVLSTVIAAAVFVENAPA